MNQSTQIFIDVALVPVGPRRERLPEQPFAVLLGTRFDGDPPAQPDDALLPWNWKQGSSAPYQWPEKQSPNEEDPPTVAVWAFSKSKNDWNEQPLKLEQLSAQREPRLTDFGKREILAWVRDLRPVSADVTLKPAQDLQELPHKLGYLATKPGTIATELRLVHYFRIAQEAMDVADWADIERLVAVPLLAGVKPPKLVKTDAGLQFEYRSRLDNAVVELWANTQSIKVGRSAPARSATSLCFDDEPLQQTKGLDFADYWLKPESVQVRGLGTAAGDAAAALPAIAVRVLPPEGTYVEDWLKLAGIGLLIRASKGGTDEWRCLTAAQIAAPGTEEPTEAEKYLNGPAIIPLRPTTITKVVKPGEREETRRGLEVVHVTDLPLVSEHPWADLSEVQLPLGELPGEEYYRYYPADDLAHDRFRPQPLRYGEEYDIAAFMIDSAGGMPVGVSSKDVPWQMQKTFTVPPPEVGGDGGGRFSTVRLVRRTGVGHAEVRAQASDDSARTWPSVPEKVFPIAGDLPADADFSPVLLARSSAKVKAGDELFRFGVRVPAVDIRVFEAMCPVGEWDLLRRGLETCAAQLMTSGTAIGLDDPAVAHLWLGLEQWDFEKAGWVTLPGKIAAKAAIGERSDFVPIRMVAGDKAGFDGSEITLPPARDHSELLRVSIYAAVSDGDLDRFDPTVLDQQSTTSLTGKIDKPESHPDQLTYQHFKLLDPVRFVVELASKAVPATVTGLHIDSDVEAPRRLHVMLDSSPELTQLRSATVERRSWRWNGMPRAPLGSRKLEEEAFKDPARFTYDVPLLSLAHTEPGRSHELVVDDFSGDPQAQYLGYVVTGFPRYPGFYTEHEAQVQSMLAQEQLPYIGQQPHPPQIRFIMPLTQRQDKGQVGGAAAILIALDESAFAGGYAESIEVEVAESANGAKQIGRDPILSDEPLPERTWRMDLHGPYGHTFDAPHTFHPHFATASYFLEPPIAESNDGLKTEPWTMAQIRLRRIYAHIDSAAPGGSRTVATSDWTVPTWIQFLPASDFAPSEPQLVDRKLPLSVALGFSQYLLLTSEARDYAGRPVETFAFLTHYQEALPAAVHGRFLARLLEVQLGPGVAAPPANVLIDELLPPLKEDVPDTDLRVRLTRVSPPFELEVR